MTALNVLLLPILQFIYLRCSEIREHILVGVLRYNIEEVANLLPLC